MNTDFTTVWTVLSGQNDSGVVMEGPACHPPSLGDPQGLCGKQQQDLIMVYKHEAKCCIQKTYWFRNSSGVKILFCIAERRCSSCCPKGTTSWSASKHRVFWGGTKGQWAEKWSGWTGYCAHKWTTERAGGMEIAKSFLIVNIVIRSQKCDSLRQHKIVVYYLDWGLTVLDNLHNR